MYSNWFRLSFDVIFSARYSSNSRQMAMGIILIIQLSYLATREHKWVGLYDGYTQGPTRGEGRLLDPKYRGPWWARLNEFVIFQILIVILIFILNHTYNKITFYDIYIYLVILIFWYFKIKINHWLPRNYRVWVFLIPCNGL